MIDLGQHAQFIVAAYAGVFVGVGLLIGWTVFAARRTTRRLDALGETVRRDRAA